LLGIVYFFAFLSLVFQVLPLIGSHGLLPADAFLERMREQSGDRIQGFFAAPSIFWFHVSDSLLVGLAYSGLAISACIVIGFANAPMLFLNWFLYMSFVHIGQIWYGFGWEIQLLETGFLAIFLCPILDPRPFAGRRPPALILWLFLWLAFRIYMGAGLIKLRGDECWRELTCLYWHYETQPLPNPLSPYFHFLPETFHRAGALLNHFIELIVPLFLITRILRRPAGLLLIGFQILLILSGNLAFLNYLTIVPCIACLDDGFWIKIIPRWFKDRVTAMSEKAPGRFQQAVACFIFAMVGFLSIPVVRNLLATHHAMNSSFGEWDLVNTYGAFGSVGKTRYELIFEGTDADTLNDQTIWLEY